MEKNITGLKAKSQELRERVLEICISAKTGHVTSSLSCVEILVALYYGKILRFDPSHPEWEDRDRLIFSKGHASPILYSILADLGFFANKDLDNYSRADSMFGAHLQHHVPGVEITAGALGHGLGVAAGMALAAKMDRQLHMIYTVLSDGELYEGSTWETVMFAAHNRLNNLVAIVDRNFLCTTDFTENLLELEPLSDKWQAFGWNVHTVDGHRFEELMPVLAPLRSRRSSRPTVIIAETTKGEGIDCMSNIPLYHGVPPKKDIEALAQEQLRQHYSQEQ